MKEAQIRDFLADHLDMVEPGLRLVRKEDPLPNAQGSRGFIDILARDRYGLYVVIEVKRTNKAAREAAHEFFKYVSLLKAARGISKERIRCILLAVEWWELAVPFSELIRTTGYQAEGFQIILDEETGLPRELRPVAQVPEGSELTLCPHHIAFSYSARERRAAAAPSLLESLAHRGLTDYLVVELDYIGTSAMIIYPFAYYLAISPLSPNNRKVFEQSLTEEERQELLRELGSHEVGIDDFDEETDIADENEWIYEDLVFRQILEDVFGSSDEVNACSPETFSSLLKSRRVISIIRGGRWSDTTVITDSDVLTALTGLSGESTHSFIDFGSPRLTAAWASLKKRIYKSLVGNALWEEGVTAYLEEIELSAPCADVSVLIFNPDSLAMALYQLLTDPTSQPLPALEIVMTEDMGRTQILFGYMEWDGVTCPPHPEVFIKQVAADPFEFILKTRMGLSTVTELIFLLKHGLDFALAELDIKPGSEPKLMRVDPTSGKLIRESLDRDKLNSFEEFLLQNRGYLHSYRQLLATVMDHAHG